MSICIASYAGLKCLVSTVVWGVLISIKDASVCVLRAAQQFRPGSSARSPDAAVQHAKRCPAPLSEHTDIRGSSFPIIRGRTFLMVQRHRAWDIINAGTRVTVHQVSSSLLWLLLFSSGCLSLSSWERPAVFSCI